MVDFLTKDCFSNMLSGDDSSETMAFTFRNGDRPFGPINGGTAMGSLKYLCGVAAVLGAVGLQPAAAATQLCPGVPVPGVSPPITNGSSCNQLATSDLLTLGFGGKNAGNHDQLWLNGSQIFDNNTDPQGALAFASVVNGDPLLFTLKNLTTGQNFDSGVGYTNIGGFSPVYHFAFLKFTDATDFNSIFSPLVTIVPGGPIDMYILNHGGYAAWTFGGGEDLSARGTDDWNDLIFGFTGTVPEASTWAMMLLGFAGLGVAALRARKDRRAIV